MKIEKSDFGVTSSGEGVDRFECTNRHGLSMSLISYGATMQSMLVPDRSGVIENINLGVSSIQAYEKNKACFGSTVGRFCNRIGGAKFTLDGREFFLSANQPPNCLHGGLKGFDQVVWQAEPIQENDRVGVRFTHISPDGDEGFPGELTVTAEYTLNDSNELTIEFFATTDVKTVLNLTNHNYWNLAGQDSGPILNHVVQIEADQFLEVDETLIPTGGLAEVNGTELDFRTAHPIGDRIESLRKTAAKGYDHCYALRSQSGELALAATVSDPQSGRLMKISTTQPGIQLYTGNWLQGDEQSSGFSENAALCLETQHFPDAPNIPSFPSTELNPGETFNQRTVHWFGNE